MTPKELSKELSISLSRGNTMFAYRKKNGEFRFAKGTTNLDLVPEEAHPTGSQKSFSENVKRYYDNKAKAWRSLDIENLLWLDRFGCSDIITEEEHKKLEEYVLPF